MKANLGCCASPDPIVDYFPIAILPVVIYFLCNRQNLGLTFVHYNFSTCSCLCDIPCGNV